MGYGTVRGVLALLVALTAAAHATDTDCTEVTECLDGQVSIRADGAPQTLVLTWSGPGARAAAALLLPLLRARRLCRLRLCEAPLGLCSLLEAPPSYLSDALVLGVESGSSLPCPNATARLVSTAGGAPAPLRPRLYAALSHAALREAACLGAGDARFYNTELPARCDFGAPLAALVPREWRAADDAAVDELLAGVRPRPRRIDAARADLVANVSARAGSFLFVDAELWGDEPRALLVRSDADWNPAWFGIERNELIVNLPWLPRALRSFKPPPHLLREQLAREATEVAADPGTSRSTLASRAAHRWPELDGVGFEVQKRALRCDLPERYRAVVYECAEEKREDSVLLMLRQLKQAVSNATRSLGFELQLETARVSCLDRDALTRQMEMLASTRGAHRLLGAVAPGAGVAPAAAAATQAGFALLPYGASGARAGATLRAVLRACGWRRAALLTQEGVPEAEALAAALAGPLVRRAPLPREPAALRETLLSLYEAGARVFVLNALSSATARTLSVAAGLRLRDAAWLAREWAGPAPPPLPLLAPGGSPRSAQDVRPGVRLGAVPASDLLTQPWPEGPWPACAGPIADAVLALALGFAHLMDAHPEERYDHRNGNTLKLFRRSLANSSHLPGVAGNLTFDESGALRAPPPRLELWRPGEARPALYAAGAYAAACPAPRVADGASACTLPVGDPFAPRCLDALAAAGVPLLLLCALLAGYGVAMARSRTRRRRQAFELRLRAEASAALLARQPDTVPALVTHLVDRARVRLLRELGAGRYGRVWLAELAPAQRPLAAKAPHAGCAPAEEGELLREAALLAPLRHPHVLRLEGVCVSASGVLLLTPVARHGDLLRYLRARRPPGGEAGEARHVAAPALTRLLREAALALAYLASRALVHRDVRAANCLVDERRSLRLADFGMARPLTAASDAGGECEGEYRCRRRALFPVLWMAPESLARGAFTCASDVWALGVLALELTTLGARPFGALEAGAAVALVTRGGRARLPAGCSADTRLLTRACWHADPARRPTARQLADWLEARPDALTPVPPLADAADAAPAEGPLDSWKSAEGQLDSWKPADACDSETEPPPLL